MSEALYRKYRPKSFSEVLGQDHIVQTLKGALKDNAVAHAYLFAGPRGTGKTTIARILADAVGCTHNDLVEIDAASNRGIDDVRELKSAIAVLPFESPKKVYIIDEVHMLTKEAFNALLKTLEEPPAHVMFILATTEIDRLPETIISRCQTLHFKQPSPTTLVEMLDAVTKKEGYNIEKEATELIALIAEGSFRDAHGILQKAMSATDGTAITREVVESMTGAPKGALVHALLSAIKSGDKEAVFAELAKASRDGMHPVLLAELLVRKFRQALLYTVAPLLAKKYEEGFSEADVLLLSSINEALAKKALIGLLSALGTMPKAYDPYIVLELSLLEVLS
jgi:DNA polymerase-3 subunit gamma/tau